MGGMILDPILFGVFTLLYIFVLIWGVKRHKKTASAILFLVVIALIYDNGVLAVGHLIGGGELLELLNYGRYWLHALFTPTLILFSYFILREAGIHLAQKNWMLYLYSSLTIVAIIVEYFVELHGLRLAIQDAYGVLSYVSTQEASGPPPMIVIVLVALLFASIALWWKVEWWWMLVGTVVMSLGSAIPIDVGSNAITNAFELFLIIMLMLTAIHFSNKSYLYN